MEGGQGFLKPPDPRGMKRDERSTNAAHAAATDIGGQAALTHRSTGLEGRRGTADVRRQDCDRTKERDEWEGRGIEGVKEQVTRSCEGGVSQRRGGGRR